MPRYASWDDISRWLGLESSHLKSLRKTRPFRAAQLKTDSREINEDDWFIPLRGDKFDGHSFIADTLTNKRAGGFFYQFDSLDKIPPELLPRGIGVNNTLETLGKLAHGFRCLSQASVIAITGSTGKTTVKEMVFAILKAKYPCTATTKNFNNEIGVPLTLLAVKPEDRFAIIEAGARKADDIKYLMHIIEPDIGVCLNASQAHLEIFGSFDNLLNTKSQIITELPTQGLGIYNYDQVELRQKLTHDAHRALTFGYTAGADIQIVRWTRDTKELNSILEIRYKGAIHSLQLNLIHESTPINVAATVAICLGAGLGIEEIYQSTNHLQSVTGRFLPIKVGSRLLIDDCYNANPASMLAGLKTFSELARAYKYPFIIIGDMLELGSASDREHSALGQTAARLFPTAQLIYVGTNVAKFEVGIQSLDFPTHQFHWFNTVDELIEFGPSFPEESAVFLKASHGVGLAKYLDHLRQNIFV